MRDGLDQQSPLTQGLPFLLFPFASPLSQDPEKLAASGLHLTVLARSDERSWLAPWSPELIQSYQQPERGDDSGSWSYDGPQDLAYFIEGTFPAVFAEGEPIPPRPGGEPSGVAGSLVLPTSH